MFRTDFNNVKSEKEVSELLNKYESKEKRIENYPIEFLAIRTQMIDWLIFICQSLSFKIETLFRAISIYDLYISKNGKIDNLYENKLAVIASLNLSTKIEEINCNFLKFLTENVLNGGNCEVVFSSKDLAKKELEILKKLSFKTNQTTSYQFLTIFQQLCFNCFGKDLQTFTFILNTSEEYLKLAIKNEKFLYNSQKDLALFAINQCLLQLSYTNTINNSIVLNLLCNIFKLNTPEKAYEDFNCTFTNFQFKNTIYKL